MPVRGLGACVTLRTFAEERISAITGKPVYGGFDPSNVLLGMVYRPRAWAAEPLLPVENPDLARLLGIEPEGRKRVSPVWVMKTPAARNLVMGGKASSSAMLGDSTRRAIAKFQDRFEAFLSVSRDFKFVPVAPGGMWLSPRDLEDIRSAGPTTATQAAPAVRDADLTASLALDDALRGAFQPGGAPMPRQAVDDFLSTTHNLAGYMTPGLRSLDYFNTGFRPFKKTSYVFLLSLVCFAWFLFVRRGVSRTAWIVAFVMLSASTAALIAALTIRAILAGRLPLANMYESVVFTMGAFCVTGLVLEAIYRNGWIGAVMAFCGWSIMALANSLPVQMRRIDPLAAVLNSVWLNWHVATVLFSYGLFLMSFIFCILYLVKDIGHVRGGILPRRDTCERLCWRCVQAGWPLLTAGILLGAVWANTAWGNAWSWDPKETWSLITWLTYAIYLHLRRRAGWKGRRAIIAAMAGFVMVLVTYFGVSYLPGISGGLHTYAGTPQ